MFKLCKIKKKVLPWRRGSPEGTGGSASSLAYKNFLKRLKLLT